MHTVYLWFCIYMRLKSWHYWGMYPLIYQCYWSRYMRIHYMQSIFLGPYLSNITRSTCTHISAVVSPSQFEHPTLSQNSYQIPILSCWTNFNCIFTKRTVIQLKVQICFFPWIARWSCPWRLFKVFNLTFSTFVYKWDR